MLPLLLGMPDSLDALDNGTQRDQLSWLRTNYGEVIESARLARLLQGFRSQKGIYKPARSPYALWVRETLRGPYPDQEPEFNPDGTWLYRYSPEGRQGRIDLSLDTNRALLRCQEDRVPVGVLRQKSAEHGSAAYEILGLAYVVGFDGTHFLLRGEAIEWEELAPPEQVPPFRPFEERDPRESLQRRQLRDQRFGVTVRMAYHEKCSLCEVGYRVRGRPLGLEAAHIIPVSEHGNSVDIRNGVLLCRNHHTLFDGFAWTPDEDLRVFVADDEQFRRSAAANCVLDWEGKRLPNLPGRVELLPAAEAVRYRLDQFEQFWRSGGPDERRSTADDPEVLPHGEESIRGKHDEGWLGIRILLRWRTPDRRSLFLVIQTKDEGVIGGGKATGKGHFPFRPCAPTLGRTFSALFPLYHRPRPCFPAGMSPGYCGLGAVSQQSS